MIAQLFAAGQSGMWANSLSIHASTKYRVPLVFLRQRPHEVAYVADAARAKPVNGGLMSAGAVVSRIKKMLSSSVKHTSIDFLTR